MALPRALTQLSRGLLAEQALTAHSQACMTALAERSILLRRSPQAPFTGTPWQRGLHTLHDSSLSHLSSTSHSSTASARSSLTGSPPASCRPPSSVVSQHSLHTGSRSCSMAPATVRRWQSSLQSSSQTTYLSNSGSRSFASQSQRTQQLRRLQKKSSEQGVYLISLVVGMIGLTYASVPLYRCAADCLPW